MLLSFLRQTRRFINVKEPVCIVLGNESCDLDSAVSAIALSYFFQYSTRRPDLSIDLQVRNFIPVLNIPREDFPLKTEVEHLLSSFSVTDDQLIFKDDLTSEFYSKSHFILVDHHNSPWSKQTLAVYDHRPRDIDAIQQFNNNCELHIETVGSCATLIGELFLEHNVTSNKDKEVLSLIRNTIVLDTVNFSSTAKRYTEKDEIVCRRLEEKLQLFTCLTPRVDTFDELIRARADVKNLNAAQLLRKDLKIIISKNGKRIALPGLPMLVKQYIQLPNTVEAINTFALDNNISVFVLLGLLVLPTDQSIQRDIGLININDKNLYEIIQNRLVNLINPNLHLLPYDDCDFMSGIYFKQLNLTATRKHILPSINAVVDNYNSIVVQNV